MTALPGWPAVTGAATFQHIRRALAGQVVRSAAGALRKGIFPGSADLLVTGTGTMNVAVGAFVAVLDRNGAVFVANDGSVNVLLSSAPGSGSRWSVVYVKQRESESPFSDGADGPVLDKVESTTSEAAARALLPTGALELAVVQVNAGSANTNAVGVTITQTFLWTQMAGAVVPVRNATELAAWAPAAGALATQIDTNELWQRSASAWLLIENDPKLIFARAAANVATNGSVSAIASLAAVVDNGAFTHSAGVFTCVKAGTYTITLSVFWAANASGSRACRITTSTSLARAGKDSPTAGIEAGAIAILTATLAVGDTVTVWQQQSSGGNLSMAAEVTFDRVA